MEGPTDFPGGRRPWIPVTRPGEAGRNRGIAALAIAAGGYLLGFLVPWATRSGGAGRFVFVPLGGIASLVFAVFAIHIGLRVRRFTEDLPVLRRERLEMFMDLEKEKRRASMGMMLGVISIVVNPLVAFAVLAICGYL